MFKTSSKIYVNCLILHEIKNEILLDYTGDSELIGSMLICKIEQKNNRYKIIEDFENNIKAIVVDYHSEGVIFTGWFCKLNVPDFDKMKKSQ